jgi:DHA2 family multidrug resistance protein
MPEQKRLTFPEKVNKMAAEQGEIVRWMITVAVSLGALLELIDTSIVNVALPHIQGNLGATLSEAGWVITGYSCANAVIIPLTAWLGDVFGRKGYFMFSMIGFTIASITCGMAPNLPVLVISRIAQGLMGGGLLAKAQAILFETFPKEKQGMAQGFFGVCVIVGPILGPTLGGYLTDVLDWRWIFFINIPFGILALLMVQMFLPADDEHKFGKVDYWGILFLTVALGSFQYVLEKGQDDDWFSSRTIVALSVAAVVGGILFLVRELTTKAPAVELRVLKHRSVAAGTIYSLVLGFGLYGVSFAVPNFAQTALSYTAMQTGMLQLPGSIASGFMMPIVGIFSSKIDARLQIFLGAICTSLVMFNLATVNLNTGWDSLFWPLIIRGIATVFMFMPLTMATLSNCPPKDIPAATAFFSLSRQMGGSIGIAVLTTVLARRVDFHRAVLVENLTPFNQNVVDRMHTFQGMFQANGASPADAMSSAKVLLNQVLSLQCVVLSFEDVFWILGVIFIVTLPLLLLMGKGGKRPGAAAAAH